MSDKPQTVQTYRLRNLDCADCAVKIESSLQQTPGVRFARLNFATGILTLDADDPSVVQQTIERIEPQVTVAPLEAEEEPVNENPDRELWRLGAAALFFVGGLFAGAIPWLHVALFLAAYLLSGGPVLWSAARNLWRAQMLDESFLMTVATLGAWFIGKPAEAVGVMLFYGIGEYLQARGRTFAAFHSNTAGGAPRSGTRTARRGLANDLSSGGAAERTGHGQPRGTRSPGWARGPRRILYGYHLPHG